MMTTKTTQTLRSKVLSFAGLLLVCGIFLGITSQEANAQQVPPASTTIGNQANATYIDNQGNTQNVTSNTVETVVQQVAGVTISPGVSKTVSPGGQVTFSHTITNTSNGADQFNLTAVDAGTGDFTYTNIVIYPDADGNGVADNFTPITQTPNIDAFTNNTFGIVIVADVPASATDAQTQDINVTATSVFDSNESDAANNTTTVDENAVVNVQKSVSQSQADVGETVTFTLNFSNNGNANATNLIIKDALPAGITYVAGSGLWSGSGSALGDNAGNGDDPSGITYEFKTGGAQDSLIATITNVNSGASGTLQFDATIDTGTEGQTITNVATFEHDDLTTPTNTNNSSVTVNESFGIAVVGADTVSQGPVNQGATVDFVNEYTNTGTTTDRYNITLSNDTYPSGTTFTLLKSDGSGNPTSPFTDTNSDGIPDTGPVAAGDNIQVILRVNLPSGVSGSDFTVDKTLTSVNDPTKSDTHVDRLTDILQPTVDITNDAAAGETGALGEGQGPEGSPLVTETTDPGTTVNFSLFVKNTSSQSDSYDLAFGTTVSGNDLDNPGNLPTGWTVQFRDPNNGNSVITQTGNLAAGASKELTAQVTIPAGFAPGDVELYFRAKSPNTGALDVKHDRVTVNTKQSVSLVSNNSGQVSPGGSKTYSHTFSINSNVTENDGSNSDFQLDLSNSQSTGWTAQVYWDRDGDGILDTGTGQDSLLKSAASTGAVDFPADIGTLNFGDQVKFIVVVSALAGLQDGASNTTTITVSDLQGNIVNQVNTDITEVQAGLVLIEKFQAPDVTGSPGTFTKSQFNVLPGDTVYYRLIVRNDGSLPVTSVEVSDVTPSFTTLLIATTTQINNGTVNTPTITEPAVGNTGTIQVDIDQLDPTEEVQIDFAVKVDN